MKALYILLVFVPFLFASDPSQNTQDDGVHISPGVGLFTGSAGTGVHGRLWFDDFVGSDIRFYNDWTNSGRGGQLAVLIKPPFQIAVRPYIALGGGYHFENIDKTIYDSPYKATLGFGTFYGALGAETRLGKNQTHGISAELAYNYGEGEYTIERSKIGDPSAQKETFDVDRTPFQVSLFYTYYFGEKRVTDNDKDGIKNKVDRCPDDAEDKDGFMDEDGCPDTDNDADGIVDSLDQCPNQAETANEFQDEDGCPDKLVIQTIIQKDTVIHTITDSVVLPPVVKEIPRGGMVLKNVGFEEGKATLTKESYSALDAIVLSLKDAPEASIQIQGYTDNIGHEAQNIKLSLERANSVKTYLISKEIKASRLDAVGFGQKRPIADNSTPEGRELNRRVELHRID